MNIIVVHWNENIKGKKFPRGISCSLILEHFSSQGKLILVLCSLIPQQLYEGDTVILWTSGLEKILFFQSKKKTQFFLL